MILAVIDTNVLVSAFWSKSGNPAKILTCVFNKRITVCYNESILSEYAEVLKRDKFGFDADDVDFLVGRIQRHGLNASLVEARPCAAAFSDESDRPFYEAAKACGCHLITGNAKHFPNDGTVISPADFCKKFL